jgi:hypothetical protein
MSNYSGFGFCLVIALLAASCGADTADSGGSRSGRSGSGSGAGSGSSANGGRGGPIDDFGNVPTGTAGGVGHAVKGTGGKGDTGDCVATGAEAEVGRQGADMVWIIDNSCSMAVEAVAVQTNMNRFAQALIDKGIDVHLVLVSSSNTSYQMNVACPPNDFVCALGMLITGFIDFGICIAAPFGSGTCPNDSLPPNYLHVPIPVGSNNVLQMALDNYPMYASMMRPNASKHFAVVTDDESNIDAATFTAGVAALDPTLFASWRFHGIFSFTKCPDAANVSAVYPKLVTDTGGVSGDLCTQTFDPVFDALAMDVVMKAEVACDWPIPTPPAGQTLDPAKVNVNLTLPGGKVVALGKIPAGQKCDGREGWYYDHERDVDGMMPTTVLSCPASCDGFKTTGGKVDVLFGCNSMVVE